MEYGLVRCWAPHYGVGSFLVCTALVLSLSFSSGVLWGVEHEIVLGHILGPSRSFIARPRRLGFIEQGFGPLTQSGLGPQIFEPHNIYIYIYSYSKKFRRSILLFFLLKIFDSWENNNWNPKYLIKNIKKYQRNRLQGWPTMTNDKYSTCNKMA